VLSPEQLDSGPYLPVTEMKVLVSTEDASVIKDLPGVPVTGIRFDDGRYLVSVTEGAHPSKVLGTDPDGLVESLAAGQVAMAQACFPQPVYVQLADLRTDEFARLEGGEDLERSEAIPAMGFRGVTRLIAPEGEPLLRAEARAIRRARRDLHMTNLHLVIPFPRTVDEVETLYNVLFEEGVRRTANLRVYIDVSVPSTLLFLHLYSQVSDGFFVRLDELLPSLLSIDPSSEGMQGSGYLTAHEKAVRQAILLVTEAAHQAKREVIIETSGVLDPGLVEFLLRIGINGICLGTEGLRENVALISEVEHDLAGEGNL
jgi:pyruvate,water dikinase